MFLGVLNTVFLNISNYLPNLELRNRSIQIVVVTNLLYIECRYKEIWLYFTIISHMPVLLFENLIFLIFEMQELEWAEINILYHHL